MLNRRHKASSDAGDPGNFRRAIASVSMAWSIGSVGIFSQPSSAFEELHVEARIVDHQLGTVDKIEKGLGNLGEDRLVAQEIIVQPCTSNASCGIARSD